MSKITKKTPKSRIVKKAVESRNTDIQRSNQLERKDICLRQDNNEKQFNNITSSATSISSDSSNSSNSSNKENRIRGFQLHDLNRHITYEGNKATEYYFKLKNGNYARKICYKKPEDKYSTVVSQEVTKDEFEKIRKEESERILSHFKGKKVNVVVV